MKNKLKTAVYFLICIMGVYLIFIISFGFAINKLNNARDEELKAITLKQDLMRRVTKKYLAKVIFPPEDCNYRQDSEFNLPLVINSSVQDADAFPENTTPEEAPDYMSITTQHFKIFGYNKEMLGYFGTKIEQYYENIVNDAGLYEAKIFTDGIRVDILRDKEDYMSRTGKPQWSAGFINVKDSSICSYEGRHLKTTIPHELAHLMMEKYLGDKARKEGVRWLLEGIAVYQEMKHDERLYNGARNFIKQEKEKHREFSAEELMSFNPESGASRERIDLWYTQAGALTGYLIKDGGAEKFQGFCTAIKNGDSVQDAFSFIYGGLYGSIDEINKKFVESL